MKKCLGAVSTSSELRLIWLAMLKRPENSATNKIFTLASKFNKILEEVISGDTKSHILKPEIDMNSNSVLFDRSGNRTPSGLIQYWKKCG